MQDESTNREIAGAAQSGSVAELLEPLAAAFDGIGIGLWTFDARTDEVRWSPALCRIFGLEPAQAPKSYEEWRRLVHPDDVERIEAKVKASLVDGRYPDLEHRIIRPSGEVRHIFARAQVETDERGQVARLVGTTIDLTERHLSEAARLDDFGRLAGGVAHHFNNMLTMIAGSVNLALELTSPADPRYSHLADIREAAQRSAALASRLFTFARGAGGDRVDVVAPPGAGLDLPIGEP